MMTTTKSTTTDVLIVGAGPVGLTAAAILRQHDVDVVVIERDDGPISQSRATWIHPRTLELWASVGMTAQAKAEGVVVDAIDMRTAGRLRARLPYDGTGRTAHPHGVQLEQCRTQRLLLSAAQRLGAKVSWATELAELTQLDDAVHAVTTDGRTLHAQFVVGADGGSSAVRKRLDIPLSGGTYDSAFFLADIVAATELSHDHAHLNFTGRTTVALLPLPGGGRFRAIGNIVDQSAEGGDGGYGRRPDTDEVIGRLRANELPVAVSEVGWSTTYRSHYRVADAYVRGRVAIAGDAAHLHSPAGGLGLNTGVADAANLAWKIASCLGGAPIDLLNSYEDERRAVAQQVVSTSDRLFNLQANPGAGYAFMRREVLPRIAARLVRTQMGRRLAFTQLSGVDVSYAKTGIALGGGKLGNLRAGDRLPDHAVDGERSAHQLLRPATNTLITFGSDADGASWPAAACSVGRWSRIDVSSKSEFGQSAGGSGAVWVRPDSHIGWAGRHPDELLEHAARWFGRTPLAGRKSIARPLR